MATDTRQPPDSWAALLDLKVIQRLVRHGLGCECPDEVFDDVVVGRPTVFTEADPRSTVQVLVGRRLLVSLVEVNRLHDVRVEAEQLLMQGRRVRDARHLNRFRLVLVGCCELEVVEALSARVARIDDRLHIHAFGPEDLAALLSGPRIS
jgi:hypothetical protein